MDMDQLTLEMWLMEGMLAFQSKMTSFRMERFPAKVVVANWLLESWELALGFYEEAG